MLTAVLSWLSGCSLLFSARVGNAADLGLRAQVDESKGVNFVEYWSGPTLVGRATDAAPAGVELRLPEATSLPVQFRTSTQRPNEIELGPTHIGALTLRLRLVQKTPSLVERVLEVRADAAQRFAVTFPIEAALEGEFATFSGPEKARTLYETVRGSARTETFPVAMVRTSDRVMGLIADSPGLWENRCEVLLDPPAHRLAILTGDGRAPYPLIIKPPEDARDTYQYQMDGWQSLQAGETRRFTSWVFLSPARTHYDAQVAAHLAVANAKGWSSSVVEAILRNTSLFLLRRNLALDANQQPRDGRYIFISGPGYGWKQWVSDGFYTALGLDDPEKTIESNRAVFWTRMDYEDNAQYYLIWAVLMKRAGGTINESLVRKAYQFLRHNEKDGLFIPPPLPGAPNSKGWKTYHDVLPYDDGDSPASDQGFQCGALLAAQELGLGVSDREIDRAVAAYQSLFNVERGFMPTSLKQRDILGQDTLYGAALTYAVFGKKLLTGEQVLTHVRTSEKVKTPYGLRVISQADGSLLPGHSGVYCYGGSWFLNDAANYLLAGVHGLPAAEVDALLIERIAREIAFTPAFNESISTITGRPHGHVLYSWNSGYWWLRREIRKRLGQAGPDPVDAAIDRRVGVVHENGVLRLEPVGLAVPAHEVAVTNELRVGSISLQVPTPEGFAPVSPERTRLTAALDLNALSAAKRLISFIPQADASLAKESIPEFDRSFHIQIAKDMLESSVSPDWFLEYKTKTRALLTDLARHDQRQLPPELANVEQLLTELDNREKALGLSIGSITFPPHQDTERVFAYSGLTTAAGEEESSKPHTTANTVAALFVKEKVFMVLVSGGRYDLAWTRAACSNWTAAILTANTPSVSPSSKNELALPIGPGKRRGELQIPAR